jgi:hypothetical protein
MHFVKAKKGKNYMYVSLFALVRGRSRPFLRAHLPPLTSISENANVESTSSFPIPCPITFLT